MLQAIFQNMVTTLGYIFTIVNNRENLHIYGEVGSAGEIEVDLKERMGIVITCTYTDCSAVGAGLKPAPTFATGNGWTFPLGVGFLHLLWNELW